MVKVTILSSIYVIAIKISKPFKNCHLSRIQILITVLTSAHLYIYKTLT